MKNIASIDSSEITYLHREVSNEDNSMRVQWNSGGVGGNLILLPCIVTQPCVFP